MRMAARELITVIALLLLAGALSAGEADVIEVESTCNGDRVCTFSVTVRHADDGWEHFADRWEIQTLDGDLLGRRVLQHPHDTEQPFTRSISGVRIPPDVTLVRIRARDSRHGYGGRELVLDLATGETRSAPADPPN